MLPTPPGRFRGLRLAGAALAVLLTAGGPAAGQAVPSSFGAARRAAQQAHLAHDIPRAHELLVRAATLEGSPEQEASVQRRLALLEWRYQAEFDAARERLRRATAGPFGGEAWLALARLELAAGQFVASQTTADRALFAADTLALQTEAQLARARALVEQAKAARRAGQLGQIDGLESSLSRLEVVAAARPGSLDEARLLMQAALLLDRGELARAAFRSYYHLAPGQPSPPAIAEALERVDILLPGLVGAEPAPLVEALAEARLIDEAELVARDPRHDAALREDRQIRELLTYAEAIRTLRGQVAEYYRRMSLGPMDMTPLTEATRSAARRAWDVVQGPNAVPPADDESLWRLLQERFGVFVRLARTPPRYDLHMGYSLIDETRTVEQYGRTAELRFVLVDNMVSQGFTDWAWEGRTGTRSYASPTTIYQIRSAQVPDTLFAWRLVSDPQERGAFERRLRSESGRDDQRALANPVGYLRGLAMRLRQQGRVALYDEIRARGLEGEALRATFMREYDEAIREASVVAHEGRHAMDLRDNAQYRREHAAKLSEVAFASRPRLALTAIFDSTIGTPTPHGRANSSIMDGLYAWIDTYRAEIEGFDPARPLLPQFDLLTDEQIREAFRSLDPYLAMQRVRPGTRRLR